ncbi:MULTISPECIES: hypothetical protein [Pseudoalteromonas]|uniref:Uncharacterized protein n=1 Tax=Pseudoalteromonas fuliginea TaxID=1872678 RepID=A0ABQ6RJS7_9GAMM|nr:MULTISPECIES: hypothetical protein [Pseudoalteromonas]KAA1158827.1 hypothetical protein EU509_07265 [Pseudoalteromonas fuliginea]KAA1167955.1 hypothetical protein EUZ79_07535 [Pseudoalteromonas fuliginea]GAA79436.1 hypothetical protein P20495_1937 [Pseudoalteromonas sp. BSi20495]
MNSTMKKVLPALLLATAFNTTSVIAADAKQHTVQSNFEQYMIGESIEAINPVNQKLQKANKIDASESLKSNIDTQTLLSLMDEKISAELDSSMSKINTQIDKSLSKVTSSITTYFSNVLSN